MKTAIEQQALAVVKDSRKTVLAAMDEFNAVIKEHNKIVRQQGRLMLTDVNRTKPKTQKCKACGHALTKAHNALERYMERVEFFEDDWAAYDVTLEDLGW